jgi:CRISPR/Cas system-associated endonuclease Cas1
MADLDAHVGFLHEMNPSKNSLAYDLQEPFRFLVDLTVISLIESKKMGFSKGMPHYMKQNAKSGKAFSLNAHVRERLKIWEMFR